MQLTLMTVGGATLLILGALVWMHVQHQAALERLDDRMAHLLAGVSLLTDTTEGALRDVATEINRMAAGSGAHEHDRRRCVRGRPAPRRSAGFPVPPAAAPRSRTLPRPSRCRKAKCASACELEKAQKERVNNYASMR